MKSYKSCVLFVALWLTLGSSSLWAQAALLLGEPYSYDGEFAGTGHAAVYLARVCADSPTHLRRCQTGEQGVVISRYHGVARRDWMAVPLIPYLYAVRNSEDVPLYVDTKLVAFLRGQYLSSLPLPAESHPGDEPRYELAGSAYDRTIYGFRIATRPEQDDALIQFLNASPNEESYKLVSRNCADFVKQIINFYYPHAIHRSIIADLGVTTPKQAAKSLVHSSKHRRQMQLTTFVIPQVPGLKRSKPVHGVIESLVLAKKYVTPVLLVSSLPGWRRGGGVLGWLAVQSGEERARVQRFSSRPDERLRPAVDSSSTKFLCGTDCCDKESRTSLITPAGGNSSPKPNHSSMRRAGRSCKSRSTDVKYRLEFAAAMRCGSPDLRNWFNTFFSRTSMRNSKPRRPVFRESQ